MAKIERVYNIPLRNEWLKAPSYKRTKRAVSAVRQFLIKHMKSEQVKIGRMLNHKLWERSIKHPPHHVKVSVVKYDDGIVRAELEGFPVEPVETESKTKKKKNESTKAEAKQENAEAAEAKKESVKKQEHIQPTKEVKHEHKSAAQ